MYRNLSNILKPGRSNLTQLNYPYLEGGTGTYAVAPSTTEFDNWESMTCIILIDYPYNNGGPMGWSPFSMYYTNGSNQKNGFYWYWAGNQWYLIIGHGGAFPGYAIFNAAAVGGGSYSTRSNAKYFMFAISVDWTSATNNVTSWGANGYKIHGTDPTIEQTISVDMTANGDSGAMGTNGKICIGGYQDGSNSVTNTGTRGAGVFGVRIWKNTKLSTTQVYNNMDYVVDDSQYLRLKPHNSAIRSVPQPTFEWKPVLDNNTTIPHTGSGTAPDLVIQNDGFIAKHKLDRI